MNRYVIIVAGGQGTRMKSTLPKQFLLVNELPVLMRTMQCFVASKASIILVLNADYHNYWKQLCNQHRFTLAHQLVNGGNTRAASVLNGLQQVAPNSLVAVHDAVRPLVSAVLIENLFNAAAQFGNAVPVVSIRESMREINGDESVAVDRDKFRTVQTPQCFKTDELRAAFQHSDFNSFTDEASLYETSGKKVHLVEGEFSNIKITFMEDLIFASALIFSGSTQTNK